MCKYTKEDKFMNEYEKELITKQRDYLVVKSNDLIQKSRYNLSLMEQKTIAFICSMIKPDKVSEKSKDHSFQLEYEFSIRDYCKIVGIDYDAGKNYADIRRTLEKLANRSMWVKIGDEEILCRWLAKVRTNKKRGVLHIEIDRDLAPYLFDLEKKFTQYQLYNILAMKSAFSIRIYELMRSYAFQENKTFDLDEFKRLLGIEDVKSYSRFPDFRRFVLEKAQSEINELTDITIHFVPITKGKKVIKLQFQIRQKDHIDSEKNS